MPLRPSSPAGSARPAWAFGLARRLLTYVPMDLQDQIGSGPAWRRRPPAGRRRFRPGRRIGVRPPPGPRFTGPSRRSVARWFLARLAWWRVRGPSRDDAGPRSMVQGFLRELERRCQADLLDRPGGEQGEAGRRHFPSRRDLFYLPVVISIVLSLDDGEMPLDDMIQEACLVLVEY